MATDPNTEGGVNPKPAEERLRHYVGSEIEDIADARDGEEEEDEEEEEEEEEEEAREVGMRSAPRKEKLKRAFRRLSQGPVRIRVHDVIIRGNAKTKDALIEAEVFDAFRSASTMQELLQAANFANTRLRRLDIFDSVSITLDSGPSELPGTANVVIDIVEVKNPLTGDLGVYTKPEVHLSWSLEGSLKLKNLLGYGDIWDASGAYGFDQTSEISVGVALPRFKAISTPITTRISLLSQDWLKFSSYKEHLLGLSVGLISTKKHDLAYSLTWRNLLDPSRMSSKAIRSQLGHSLLSSIKYTYKIDHRDSNVRPTRGYAFQSSSHIAGLGPDSKLLRFFRQEFDLRGAIPLGFYNTALNFGVAAGAILPWVGYTNSTTPLPERFYMGGHSSPICGLGGPTSLLGFKQRGLGPMDLRRVLSPKQSQDEATASSGGGDDASGSIASPGRDAIGGDLAVTAFADLSFDLPLKVFQDAGKITIFCFLTQSNNLYSQINYCYILKQFQHDHGKTGIQFSFST
ncbi:hypothetical protein ZIOFF_062908 [Zingiber officinale]|uniref:Bacterial surface antigen (D15) domain-containing protein n=1 Tax=Zingiber officinale TaxID=94328 RepID=A0A8J5KFF7_ZINOF|nr:hypothetical protein ZIOFF_062908 [Zingiber officinale]